MRSQWNPADFPWNLNLVLVLVRLFMQRVFSSRAGCSEWFARSRTTSLLPKSHFSPRITPSRNENLFLVDTLSKLRPFAHPLPSAQQHSRKKRKSFPSCIPLFLSNNTLLSDIIRRSRLVNLSRENRNMGHILIEKECLLCSLPVLEKSDQNTSSKRLSTVY